MYPKHMGHENGGCGHLGRAPLSPPTFGGHSCKKDCMVAPHESVLISISRFYPLKMKLYSVRISLPEPGQSPLDNNHHMFTMGGS